MWEMENKMHAHLDTVRYSNRTVHQQSSTAAFLTAVIKIHSQSWGLKIPLGSDPHK